MRSFDIDTFGILLVFLGLFILACIAGYFAFSNGFIPGMLYIGFLCFIIGLIIEFND